MQLIDSGVEIKIKDLEMTNHGLTLTSRIGLKFSILLSTLLFAQTSFANPIGTALDNTELAFSARNFIVDRSDSTVGGSSMKSRFSDESFPTIDTFIEGDVTITFDYKFKRRFIGAELSLMVFDSAGLAFEEEIASVSFEGWRTKSVYLPEGVEQIQWSLLQFSDATQASIDNIRVEPGNTLPDTSTIISENRCNAENPFFNNSIANAVDNTKIEFITDQSFFQQTDVSFFGDDSAQTVETQFGDSINFFTIVESDKDLHLEFYWKVSSTPNQAFLEFEVFTSDFSLTPIGIKSSISGVRDWAQKNYTIPKGSHILMWRFVNNSRNSSDANVAWVDKISIDGEFDSLCQAPSIAAVINLLLVD